MLKTKSAGGIVVNELREIALVRNGHGLPWWGFPKGHVNEGEDDHTAAIREIEEETGLHDVTLLKDLGTYERFKGAPGGGEDRSEVKSIHMFLFRSENIPLSPKDEANPEAKWVALESVVDTLTNEHDRAFFEGIRAEIT